MNKLRAFTIILIILTATIAIGQKKDTAKIGRNYKQLIRNLKANHHFGSYTLISQQNYKNTIRQTHATITTIISAINNAKSPNKKIGIIYSYFKNRPYAVTGIDGEGDWQPGSWSYRGGAAHIKQDPVYRTDRFDCQTLTQIVLALLQSNNLKLFERNYLKVSYGAAHIPSNKIHYYNRNNFISADFNPINQKNGFIKDITSIGYLAKYTRYSSATIDRANWFRYKQNPSDTASAVRVLSAKNGPRIVRRWLNSYPYHFVKFKPELVKISYIPKETLINNNYQPNYQLINKIPTPAIMEIVRDPKRWQLNIHGKHINIKQLTGTELNVTHVGIIYKHNFHQNDIISKNIVCDHDYFHHQSCKVIPHTCKKRSCHEIMFLEASDAYPNHFYWYKKQHKYVCYATKSKNSISVKKCNRVLAMPLADYLTQQENGHHVFMDSPSVLGIHLEHIQVPHRSG